MRNQQRWNMNVETMTGERLGLRKHEHSCSVIIRACQNHGTIWAQADVLDASSVAMELLHCSPSPQVPAACHAVQAGGEHQRLRWVPGRAGYDVRVSACSSLAQRAQVPNQELAVHARSRCQGQVVREADRLHRLLVPCSWQGEGR